MTDAPALIVPVNVAALCVGSRESVATAGAAADFDRLRDDDAGKDVPYNSDAIGHFPNTPLQPGIHLHWALPDALTHGKSGSDEKLRFPAVPNRWLVVRLCASATGAAPQVKSWVVESDYISREAPAGFEPTMIPWSGNADPDPRPVTQRPKRFFRYIGRAEACETWREGGRDPKSYLKSYPHGALTAVGYGDPVFAAYYPTCRSVFGFRDALDGFTDRATLSYLVIGWYSDRADDPLAAIKTVEIGKTWGWTFVQPEGTPAPDRTVCAGIVQGIAWTAGESHLSTRSAPLEMAVGNNTMECISALLANRKQIGEKFPNAQFVLDAVQSGMLTDIASNPDRWARLDAAMHEKAFASVPGGSLWVVSRRTPSGCKTGPDRDLDIAANTGNASLPPQLATALAALNLLQKKYDAAQVEIGVQQERVYLDWFRHSVLKRTVTAPETGGPPQITDEQRLAANSRLDEQLSDLEARQKACGTLTVGQIHGRPTAACKPDDDSRSLAATLAAAIEAFVAAVAAADPTFLVQRAAAPRYWQPNDPVILLAGEDVRPSARYGQDNAQGSFPCVLSSDLMNRIALTRDGRTIEIGPDDLLADRAAFAGVPVASLVPSLVAFALITDQSQAAWLATLAAAKLPGAPDVASQIAGLQRDFIASGATRLDGAAFAGRALHPQALARWQANPWIPLYLKWQAEFYPAQYLPSSKPEVELPLGMIKDGFNFDPGRVDLIADGDIPAHLKPVPYHGEVLLSRHGLLSLKDELTRYLDSSADANLSRLTESLSAAPVLTQALSGFNQLLLMQNQTIQLPIFNPDDLTNQQLKRTARIKALVARGNRVSPNPSVWFTPIRAGWLKLTGLTLIDAFGQQRVIDLTNVPIGRARAMRPRDAGEPQRVYLPPRLSQPAALQMRWLSGSDGRVEMNAHPATSPVCGWVMPNHLEESLMFYEADGTAVGALEPIGRNSDLRWQNAPVHGRSLNEGRAEDIANPQLRNLVRGIREHAAPAAYLDALIRSIDRALNNIVPRRSQAKSFGVLIGRPLALVRVSLALELKGPPAIDQGWESFQRDIARPAGAPRTTRGFTKVKFPVHLGDLTHAADGLVGFFGQHAGTPTDYMTFYSPGAWPPGDPLASDHVKSPEDVILLDCDPGSQPTVVSVLMDPHAELHATTGILPVKAIEIPADHYQDALARLQIAFLTNPVLSAIGRIDLPLSSYPGFKWSWMEANDGRWSETPEIGATSDRANIAAQRITDGWLKLAPKA